MLVHNTIFLGENKQQCIIATTSIYWWKHKSAKPHYLIPYMLRFPTIVRNDNGGGQHIFSSTLEISRVTFLW